MKRFQQILSRVAVNNEYALNINQTLQLSCFSSTEDTKAPKNNPGYNGMDILIVNVDKETLTQMMADPIYANYFDIENQIKHR